MDTWFSVDTRPFKQALLTVVKKWSYMFKQHLLDHVTNRQVFRVSYRLLFFWTGEVELLV